MKIEVNEKSWGMELIIETSNVKLTEDLSRLDAVAIYDYLFEVSRALYKYANNTTDEEYANKVLEMLDVSVEDLMEE